MCGIDPKTAKRIIEKNTGQAAVVTARSSGPAKHEIVRPLVASKVEATLAKITTSPRQDWVALTN